MKKVYIIILLFTALQSCNTITEKDLTVIEGIKLGSIGEEQYNKQMADLGMTMKAFTIYDYLAMFRTENQQKFQFNGYLTKVFTGTKYDSKSATHDAPILPQLSPKTNVLTEVVVPLTHTVLTETEPYIGISQVVSKGFLEEVKNMLIIKYGNPTDTSESYGFLGYTVPYFSKKGVEFVGLDEKTPLLKYSWKTKALNVDLYYGMKSTSYSYIKSAKSYMILFKPDLDLLKSENSGYEVCYQYSYIRYSMNQKALEKLEANKPKL